MIFHHLMPAFFDKCSSLELDILKTAARGMGLMNPETKYLNITLLWKHCQLSKIKSQHVAKVVFFNHRHNFGFHNSSNSR